MILSAAFRDNPWARRLLLWSVVAGLLWLVGLPETTQAYVPQSEHLLQLMVEKGGNVRSLKLTQRQRIWTSGIAGEAPLEVPETIQFRFPSQFRSDIESANIHRIHLVSGFRDLTVTDGEIRRDSVDWFDRYKDLILYRSRRVLANRLSEAGLDIRTSSLGRFDGRIAWVIGAQYPDENIPQLWLDKESFRPIRWLLVRKGFNQEPETFDIRYLRWKQTAGIWYPMQVEFRQDGRLLREIVVEDITVNPTLSESVFDFQQVERQVLSAPASMTPEGAGTIPSGEVDKTLDEFRRMFK